MRTHYCGELNSKLLGEEVSLCGWVHNRRDHGGVIFIDLRDFKGKAQIVIDPDTPESFSIAENIRTEYVLKVTGVVRERPKGTINEDMPTGSLEVLISAIIVLNASLTPPFPIDDAQTYSDTRLRHRIIDLRSDRMRSNLILRARVSDFFRQFLTQNEFLEVETPILTKATPEGARDYLVPSRTNPGSFFALPQSPQLFKQLLMMGGLDRYYQIVRCFRDEDLRSDRQPEFTQLDIEMSFVTENDLIALMEKMIKQLFSSVLEVSLVEPFNRMSYKDAMEKYGTDRPDLRNPLELVELSEAVRGCEFKVFAEPAAAENGRVALLKVPEARSITRSQIDSYTDLVCQHGAKGLAYIKVNDLEKGIEGLQSPILKFLSESVVNAILEAADARSGDIIFFGAGKSKIVNESLGVLRLKLGEDLGLTEDQWRFCWVQDFPMFEKNDIGALTPLHHPFTASYQDVEVLQQKPESAISRAYDLVLNGLEIGGGSIRIDDIKTQLAVLKVLGIDQSEAQEKFGFLLNSLSYGCPPHGGIAFGLDRLVMLMAGEDSIREVIAFPKTQTASCPLTDAPSEIDDKLLTELSLKKMEIR